MLTTAEPTDAAFVAVDELFHEKRVIFVGMEDEYTEYMSCVKEYLIHGSYRRETERRSRQGDEGSQEVCGRR